MKYCVDTFCKNQTEGKKQWNYIHSVQCLEQLDGLRQLENA